MSCFCLFFPQQIQFCLTKKKLLHCYFYVVECKKKQKRVNRFWVHPLNKKRPQFGAYHHLVQELQISPEKHMQYFRMSTQQMEDLLSIIGPDITGMSINYRTPIEPKEKLAVTLR